MWLAGWKNTGDGHGSLGHFPSQGPNSTRHHSGGIG
jgi:hypothetical protein